MGNDSIKNVLPRLNKNSFIPKNDVITSMSIKEEVNRSYKDASERIKAFRSKSKKDDGNDVSIADTKSSDAQGVNALSYEEKDANHPSLQIEKQNQQGMIRLGH